MGDGKSRENCTYEKKKDHGNAYFKVGEYGKATRKYDAALKIFQYDKGLSEDEKTAVDALKVQCHTNITVVRHKEGDVAGVIEAATEALKVNPNNVKCLFFRGEAYDKQKQNELALADLTQAAALDASNRDVARVLASVKRQIAEVKEKERKLYGGWFGKVSLVSDDEGKASAAAAAAASSTSSGDEEGLPSRAEAQAALGVGAGAGAAGATKPAKKKKRPAKAATAAAEEADDSHHGHSHGPGQDHGHSHGAPSS